MQRPQCCDRRQRRADALSLPASACDVLKNDALCGVLLLSLLADAPFASVLLVLCWRGLFPLSTQCVYVIGDAAGVQRFCWHWYVGLVMLLMLMQNVRPPCCVCCSLRLGLWRSGLCCWKKLVVAI